MGRGPVEPRFGSAAGAAEGLRLLEDHDSIAGVVTDLHMPEIDGWRFCRLLRSPEYRALNDIPLLVLSPTFPLDDGVDMIVSAERAKNESGARGHAFEAELALYIVHGILHVSGFDDHTVGDRATMRDAERDVLERLGLRVPSVDS